jgi:hypothetical protein
MLMWKDLGLIFDVENCLLMPDWHNSHAQAPNAIIFDDFVRVYFTGRPISDDGNNFISRAMYVDLDPEDNFRIIRVSPTPLLSLGGVGTFDEHGTYPFSVLRKNGQYVAIYGGWSRSVSVPFDISLGLAESYNGENFTKIGIGPILGPSLAEPYVITSPKLRFFKEKYFLTYTAGVKWFEYQGRKEIIYKLRSAESLDLIHWERTADNLLPDVLGPDEAQACGDIIETNSGFHMFFCYRSAIDFRSDVRMSYKIGYAFSLDLHSWKRNDQFAGISSTPGSWDEQMCAYPNLFQYKGKTYILYLGNETGAAGFGAKQLIGELP